METTAVAHEENEKKETIVETTAVAHEENEKKETTVDINLDSNSPQSL